MSTASTTLGVGGILRAEPADIVRRLVFATKEAALPEHRNLFDAMSRVNLAHVVMLHDRNLVPREVSRALASFLLDVQEGGPQSVPVVAEGGDLYPQIEGAAMRRLGAEVGGYLQLGRSRGDVIPAAMRLKLRTKTLRWLDALGRLRTVVLEVAARHTGTIMPAYTHYQQSQVMSFAHFLGRFAAWFEKDHQRGVECLRRHDQSPLGSANGVGTSIGVDRGLTARLLGHAGPVPSAGDAVYAWDYMIEPVSVASLFCSNASRLACNLVLWHTREFGFVSLSDAFATASTYLPHKRNPEPLETVKYFAEAVAGNLGTVYQLARNEDWPHSLINHGFSAINGSLDMSVDAADLMGALLCDLQVDEERMREVATTSLVTSSEVANTIVRRSGLPFRAAHEIVGHAARTAIDRGDHKLAVHDLRAAARELMGHELDVSDTELAEASDGNRFIDRLTSAGSANPQHMRELIAAWNDKLATDQRELEAIRSRCAEADDELVRRARAVAAA